jgi:transketolase
MSGETVLMSESYINKVIDPGELKKLKATAVRVRIKIIKMLTEAGSGHPGGSLSATDILVALYFHIMKINPSDPRWKGRDRFVLSKGHAAPALYSILSEIGYIEDKDLYTLRKWGSRLQGHPDRLMTPGVDMSTGSLGQGMSIASGMAIGAKIDKNDIRVYVLCSDGEHQSGMTWEAVMSAAKFKLDNLTAFIDNNGLQIDGPTNQVMPVMPLKEKYLAFNWNVIEADGHDFKSLICAATQAQQYKGKPTAIICSTIKGKGVSFMENKVKWHGFAPKAEEAELAIKELRKMENE